MEAKVDKTGVITSLRDALEVFKDERNDIRRACVENIQYLQEIYKDAYPLEKRKERTVTSIYNHVQHLTLKEKTKEYERAIRVIDRMKKKNKKGQITQSDILLAREYPIQELFTELTGEKVVRGMAKCPFHTDKTASLSFRRYNRYRCFGCDERGDTIELVMKLYGLEFIQAVRKLL